MRAVLVEMMRSRFAAFHELSEREQCAINDERVVAVEETERLFEKAMRGEMVFPGEHVNLSEWVIPRGAGMKLKAEASRAEKSKS